MAISETFRKSGVRPIIPHDTCAHRRIMLRRASRSSTLLGVMKDSPTGSPLVGDVYVMSGRPSTSSGGPCCKSYNRATVFTPPLSPGWAVASFTRSPRRYSAGGLSLSLSMYCCPFLAGMMFSPLPAHPFDKLRGIRIYPSILDAKKQRSKGLTGPLRQAQGRLSAGCSHSPWPPEISAQA